MIGGEMIRRVLVDVLIGVGLAVVGQFVQLAAGVVGPLLGLPFPYEMAPEDGSVPPELLTQINLMFLLAAVGMLVLTFALGWLLRVRGVAGGAQRGAVWALMVALVQFVLGLGNGVVPVLGLPGTWVYFLAVLLGPVLAGLLDGRRAAR